MQQDAQDTAAALGLGSDASLPAERRVTAANWRTPPYNRYALQRVQQFTRTARAPHPIEASILPEALTDIDGVSYVAPDGEQDMGLAVVGVRQQQRRPLPPVVREDAGFPAGAGMGRQAQLGLQAGASGGQGVGYFPFQGFQGVTSVCRTVPCT